MGAKKLTFAVFGDPYKATESVRIWEMLDNLTHRGAEIYVERSFYDSLTRVLHEEVNVTGVFDGGNFDADFVISLGGDGTFLEAANKDGAKQIPILGVNMGRLGFLASVLPSELSEAIADIYEGRYSIEERVAICLETAGEPVEGSPYALNDIAVLKRDNASMISVRASINGEYLVTYQADGLVISTPTGSTAYSLSNGGPIIVPQAGILALTPVAPHSLNLRPIVVKDDAVITLDVESRSHNYLVALDGRSEKMGEGTHLTIRKAPYKVRIVKRHNTRYFSTLRGKLMWGADTRE